MIIDRYEVPQTTLMIALLGGHYLVIATERSQMPKTPLTIALLGGLYLAIVMDWHDGKISPYYGLACIPLFSHYNVAICTAPNSHYYSLACWPLIR
jgi:hypothetical protein